jgi:hypothetical protein
MFSTVNVKIITGHLTVSSCTKYLIDELLYGPVVLQVISGMFSILNTFPVLQRMLPVSVVSGVG